MDKKMNLKLNGGRTVTGILRGFDPFMNVVIDDTVEECKDGTRNNIGMVVSWKAGFGQHNKDSMQFNASSYLHQIVSFQVIRGNSIIMVEALDRV